MRLNRSAAAVTILIVLAAMLESGLMGRPAVAEGPPGLPAYRALVRDAARRSWGQLPADAARGPVATLVQLDMLPLALVGMDWSQQRRQAYLREIGAAQDELAAAVQGAGGEVIARFSHASSGLMVRIDPAGAGRLMAAPGVSAVMYVGDYAARQAGGSPPLSLQELGELVGSAELRRAGVDGAGVDIALVDTGVDYTHAKLGGSGLPADYRRAACGDAALLPGQPGCNPQLSPPAELFPNAKVRGGYDYVGDVWPDPDPRCGAVGGVVSSCPYPDTNPIDIAGHGTHVADIAAGLPLAADGSDAGVAPGAGLWIFKACTAAGSQCEGTSLLRAIDAALDLDGSDRGVCSPETDPACLAYDPADVINLSVSYSYGQPEDALSLFADIAGYYGSLVVAAAGNDGDAPYIVGSPATAAAALAVAESAMPGAPEFALTAGPLPIDALRQGWSPAPAAPANMPLRYDAAGCAPLPAWPGALLVDLGGCAAGDKVAAAAAAGAALLLIADNARADTPPGLSAPGATMPVYTITRGDGERLRAALAAGPLSLSLEPAANTPTGEIVAPDSSRGPRIADGAIKPDIAAPGAVTSALAGGGDALAAFGGSSGAAPVVAGSAALIIQELERRGLIDARPGLGDALNTNLSLAPLVKAVLMNGAAGALQTADGAPAPATLQGAGRVDALRSFRARTLALDGTEMLDLLRTDTSLAGCSVNPFDDLVNYLFLKIPPPCAVEYPFGNDLMRAWNAQAGSMSFGYRPAIGYQEVSRQLVIYNYGRAPRHYELGLSLRSQEDAGRGVELSLSQSAFDLAGGATQVVTVTAAISPQSLPDWSLNGGALGNRGSAVCDAPDPYASCPSLTLFEVDGSILVDGGPNNQIRMPWQVLPRKVADVSLAATEPGALTLRNPSQLKAGGVEVFALVDVSPNTCDERAGVCGDVDYTPGARPGSDASPVDMRYIGVRSYSAPGINAELGLAPAPGAPADEVFEFAITVYDRPYRASPNAPAQFEVHIDGDLDGATDYVAFNADYGDGGDGRSAVFVRDVNPADGVRPTMPYMFTVADFNSQNWVLPVPAAAVGARGDRPLRFVVRAYDSYFRGDDNGLWDCSPGPLATCGAAAHTVQAGLLRVTPAERGFTVAAGGSHRLTYTTSPAGALASPSQRGLLLLYRDAPAGQESAGVIIP